MAKREIRIIKKGAMVEAQANNSFRPAKDRRLNQVIGDWVTEYRENKRRERIAAESFQRTT